MNQFIVRFALLGLVSSIGQTVMSATKDPACLAQSEIDPNLVNAVGIKSYMDLNGIHNIGDLACCLPKSFNATAMFAHSSISGQNSIYSSPRVILYSKNSDGTLKTALSFNGGDKSLHQNQNIEFMQTNNETKHIELFDLEVGATKSTLSGRNPTLCLSCHGDYGVAGIGGPHPIFDPFDDWQRFQSGSRFFCADNGSKYQDLIDDKTERAIASNPRYRCLKSARPADRIARLNKFDEVLDRSNGKRLVEIVRNTSEFDKFKYAIIGSQMCGFGYAFSPSKTKFDLSKWLPPKVLQQMDDKNFLPAYMKTQETIFQSAKNEGQRFLSERKVTQLYVAKAMAEIENGRKPDFVSHRKGCPTFSIEEMTQFPDPKQDTMNRYIAARIQSGAEDGAFRFLFEGRGISTSGWEMSATPGDYAREAKLNLRYLFETERDDKTVSDIYKTLRTSGAIAEIENATHVSSTV